MPDALTVGLLSAAGALFTGLASGAFVPRWTVSWMLQSERSAKTEALEALRLERARGDVQAAQLDRLLSDQQLSTAALRSIEEHVRTRDGSAS